MVFGKNINKYYLKYWYLLLIGIIALIVVDYVQLLIPDITGTIIDGLNALIDSGDAKKDVLPESILTIEKLSTLISRLLIVMAIMFVGRILWRITILNMSARVSADLRYRMFEKSVKLSSSYYSEQKTGALMAYYTNDLQTIQGSFGFGVIMTVDALVLGILAFSRMVKLNWVLALVSTIPLLILALCGKIIGNFMNKKWSERQQVYAELSDFTQENFSGLSVIKAFVKEGIELLRFNKINRKNQNKNLEFVRYSTILQVLVTLMVSSVAVIIIAGGGYLVYRSSTNPNADTFTIGMLYEYTQYFSILTWPLIAIAQLVNLVSQSKASLKRINEILCHEVEINDDLITEEAINHNIEGVITFQNFSFGYSEDKVILEDININIKKGEMIGILGKTGSGKTTLVDSLLRIYNVETNTLLIDGLDIMTYPLHKIRESIAYVPQDNFLFSDTITKNVLLGVNEDDHNTFERVVTSSKIACVDDNIAEFPLQYETVLGERGVTLSGGQKQRISIARALIKDAPILVLDDSVSAVDTKTEEKLIENLRKYRCGKTTLLIAHRISTVKELDRIILMENGKVIGFDSHTELLKKSANYRDIYRLQQLEDEKEV